MMNWKCKEFKITEYNNNVDYQNEKPSKVRKYSKNLITNNGLRAMWILALGGTFNVNNASITIDPFKIYEGSDDCTVIGIGQSATEATPDDTTINSLLDYLNVTEIILVDNIVTFKAVAEAGKCVGTWNEWGIFNRNPSKTNTNTPIMFNHKVESMGTKNDTSIWKVEIQIELQNAGI